MLLRMLFMFVFLGASVLVLYMPSRVYDGCNWFFCLFVCSFFLFFGVFLLCFGFFFVLFSFFVGF